MDAYIVSARKYRPKQFEEVVGQSHVTQTLEKAIKSNHLAQALLFTGPRGVGKTTCARILARMINEEGGNTGEGDDFSFNIFELDAASNNSVDGIRSLIDQVRFAPQTGKFKVYIIDEVHMLSASAFNAFLKTLEEPPSHAIFILATTEKHKIIPTILSRCQIYDFRRISVQDTLDHLKKVAVSEGVDFEESALHIIAEKADGALRDALSIFDRMATYGGGQITYDQVLVNLSILDYEFYFRIVDAAIQNDQRQLLLIFNEILDKGFDGHLFLNGLAAHLRDLLVSSDQSTQMLLERGEDIKIRYVSQASILSFERILESLDVLSKADADYRKSSNSRLLVELSLLKLADCLSGEKKKPSH
jgi:DNA polymerase-3 subunit gamma/tau